MREYGVDETGQKFPLPEPTEKEKIVIRGTGQYTPSIRSLKADRDSEEAWAEEYFRKWQKALEEIEADEAPGDEDRWVTVGRLQRIATDALKAQEDTASPREDFRAQRDTLRKFFEAMARDIWDIEDIDGGSFQDTAESLGLIVKVPADEAFWDEYGAGEMYVWAWNKLATEALSEKTPRSSNNESS